MTWLLGKSGMKGVNSATTSSDGTTTGIVSMINGRVLSVMLELKYHLKNLLDSITKMLHWWKYDGCRWLHWMGCNKQLLSDNCKPKLDNVRVSKMERLKIWKRFCFLSCQSMQPQFSSHPLKSASLCISKSSHIYPGLEVGIMEGQHSTYFYLMLLPARELMCALVYVTVGNTEKYWYNWEKRKEKLTE